MTKNPSIPERPARRWSSTRALTSSLAAIAFAAMAVSGIVVFAVPSGRIARAIDWSFLGLGRSDWIGIHIAFAGLFILAGIVHLAFNWRAMHHHLASRLGAHLRVRWEAIVALLVSGLLLAAAIERWPPFDYVLGLHKALKTGDEAGGPPDGPRRGGRFQGP